jgi:dTMP kinase
MFITFEGIDGAGKTTQLELLRAFLEEQGRTVVVSREPGGTPLSERIRELLLDGADMSPRTEASLFAAARAELVDVVIRPALNQGFDVIVDRYLDSSLAYQGIARGVDLDLLYAWNLLMVQELLPDRTFLLGLPAEDATLRLGTQPRLFAVTGEPGPPDRLERESVLFRRRVEEGYRELAQKFPERIIEIDASLSKSQIADLVQHDVRKLLDGSITSSRTTRAVCS